MKLRAVLPVMSCLLVLAGCAPVEPPASVVPLQTRAELERVKYFGAEVAADPAVKWRTSGLGVKITVPGEGLSPQAFDRVRVNYTGRLTDGTVFDQSTPGKPAEFTLSQLIPGMATGIGALKPGGRGVLYVPPSLGYGGQRMGKIPPVSPLIFEIELLEVRL